MDTKHILTFAIVVATVGLPMGAGAGLLPAPALSNAAALSYASPTDALALTGVTADAARAWAPDDAPSLYRALAEDPLGAQALLEAMANGFNPAAIGGMLREAVKAELATPATTPPPLGLNLVDEAVRNLELRGSPAGVAERAMLAAEVAKLPPELLPPLADLLWAANEAEVLRAQALADVTKAEIAWLWEAWPTVGPALAPESVESSAPPAPGLRAGSVAVPPEDLDRARDIAARVDVPLLAAAGITVGDAIDRAAPLLAAAAPTAGAAAMEDARPASEALTLQAAVEELARALQASAVRARDDPASLTATLELDKGLFDARWSEVVADGSASPDEIRAFDAWAQDRVAEQVQRNADLAAARALQEALRALDAAVDAYAGAPSGLGPAPAGHTTCSIVNEGTPLLGTILYVCGTGPDVLGPGPEPTLIVELGGDDAWTNSACAVPPGSTAPFPVSLVKVCLDLGGNDVHTQAAAGPGSFLAQGAGFGGVGIFVDLPLTSLLSGCGLLGCMNDVYTATVAGAGPGTVSVMNAQGYGGAGLGALIDVGGDDLYVVAGGAAGGGVNVLGQGASGGPGLGVFVDALGQDVNVLSSFSTFAFTSSTTGESGNTFALGQGAAVNLAGVGAYVNVGSSSLVAQDVMIATTFSGNPPPIILTGLPGNSFSFAGTIGLALTIAQGAASGFAVGIGLTSGTAPCFNTDLEPLFCAQQGDVQGTQACSAVGGAAIAICQGAAQGFSVGVLANTGQPGFTCLQVQPILLVYCNFNFHTVQAIAVVSLFMQKSDVIGAAALGMNVNSGLAWAICQGAGKDVAAGALVDVLGSDLWSCRSSSVATATGILQCAGAATCNLQVVANAKTGDALLVSQGASRDLGVGILAEVEGDDGYFPTVSTTSSASALATPQGGNAIVNTDAQSGLAEGNTQGAAFTPGTLITPLGAVAAGLGAHVDALGNDAAFSSATTAANAASTMTGLGIPSTSATATSGNAPLHDKGYGVGGIGLYLNVALGSPVLGLTLGASDTYASTSTTSAVATRSPPGPTVAVPGVPSTDSYGFSAPAGVLPSLARFIDLRPNVVPLLFLGCNPPPGDDFYADTPGPPPPAWGTNGNLLLCGAPAVWTQGPPLLSLIPSGQGLDG